VVLAAVLAVAAERALRLYYLGMAHATAVHRVQFNKATET
jgi:hypothetical protein